MKKNLIVLLLVLLLCFFVGCKYSKSYEVKDDEFYYILNNAIGMTEFDKKSEIIRSKEQFIEYVTLKNYSTYYHDIFKKFDDKYFKKKSLIIIPWIPDDFYRIKDYTIDDNVILFNMYFEFSPVHEGLPLRLIILEIKNKRIKNVDTIKIHIVDGPYSLNKIDDNQ